MKSKPIRIVIADDQSLIRSGFEAIFKSVPDIEVVGLAANGKEAYELATRLKPDVVLMDIRMPDMDGIEATRLISEYSVDTHVLVLTTFDIDEYVYGALKNGASGFLLKDSDPKDIVNAIKVISQGDALIQPSITKRLIEDFSKFDIAKNQEHHKNNLEKFGLTEREEEILLLIAKGVSNKEIANELFISPATVKTHIARIMQKTDSHDRAQLVIFAYEHGLVSPKL